MTLEDDEPDTPEPEVAAFVSVDAGAGHHSKLSTGLWWDAEDGGYVDDNLRPIFPV